MFFWFAACGVVLVALVFGSSGVDYRIVALGSVLPLAENPTGSPWVLHTLVGSVVLLTAVMALTAGRGRRLAAAALDRPAHRHLGVPGGQRGLVAHGVVLVAVGRQRGSGPGSSPRI